MCVQCAAAHRPIRSPTAAQTRTRCARETRRYPRVSRSPARNCPWETHRRNRSAKLSWRPGLHGTGTWMERPDALYLRVSTSGFAISIDVLVNSTGLLTPCSRRSTAKHSSTMRIALCFFPSRIIMRTSRPIIASRTNRDIASSIPPNSLAVS